MDRTKAEEIFTEHGKRLYNTALRITGCPDEAEEIMQVTLVKFLTLGPLIKTPARVKSWLTRTCVNLSIDWLRREKKMVPLDAKVEMEEEDDWSALRRQKAEQVMRGISMLPDGYRTVIVLRCIEEYEFSEIAQALKIGESTARSQFARARVKLIELLKELDNE